MIEDDLHDKLTKAYLDYFKANEQYLKSGGIRPMREAKKFLRDIRSLAKLRSDELQNDYRTKLEARKK